MQHYVHESKKPRPEVLLAGLLPRLTAAPGRTGLRALWPAVYGRPWAGRYPPLLLARLRAQCSAGEGAADLRALRPALHPACRARDHCALLLTGVPVRPG